MSIKKGKDNNRHDVIKVGFYLGAWIGLFYFVTYLNFFPGAVDYRETSEIITIEKGILNKTIYTLEKSSLTTSQLIIIGLLKNDIDILQQLLRAFIICIPFNLFFLLKRNDYNFLKVNRTFKILIILLISLLLFIILTTFYVQTLEKIEANFEMLSIIK